MAMSVTLSTLDFLEICLLHSQLRSRFWQHCTTYAAASTASSSSLAELSECERGHTEQLLWLKRTLTTHGTVLLNVEDTPQWREAMNSLALVNATLTRTLLSLINDAPPEQRPNWLATQTKRLTCFASPTEVS